MQPFPVALLPLLSAPSGRTDASQKLHPAQGGSGIALLAHITQKAQPGPLVESQGVLSVLHGYLPKIVLIIACDLLVSRGSVASYAPLVWKWHFDYRFRIQI